jgi:tetraacyldisaccharide 4'-kinase
MLEKHGIKANPHGFPDHYTFTCNDFDSIGVDSVIIMTEKDAVKCRSLGLVNAWYMPVETRLSIELEHLFQERLASLIKDSK